MDYNEFIQTSHFKKMRYQRCLYIISMKPSDELDVRPNWHKIGIASCDLRNRIRQYNTYWPSGILIWTVASCEQEVDSEICDIRKLEQFIIEKSTSISPGSRIKKTESFKNLTIKHLYIISKILKVYPNVIDIFTCDKIQKYNIT